MDKKRSDCPISCSLDVFGDRWSLLIIRDVMLRGKLSYSEFLDSEEKIATNILVSRLNILEAEKILVKEVAARNKSKYVYSLTQKGADLLPIVIEIMDWEQSTMLIVHGGNLDKKLKEIRPELFTNSVRP